MCIRDRLYSETAPASSTDMTVYQSTKRGDSGALAISVDAGEEFRVGSSDPKGIGHYTIKITFSYS